MSGYLLTAPEPKIQLYESGFKEVCKLDRAAEGRRLSELVEKISEPMVVALDAPWGAGKSVFLKCWVGAHTKELKGTAKTVYFDAFRHDFMDDPLIGLTGVITERLGEKANSKKWQRAMEAASKLFRPAVRTGLAVATYGATELSGALVDAALEAGSEELKQASHEFWKKEDGKRSAMKGFRGSLESLAAEQKLVIVVDELDRCRPDYALNLLEVIKHFFDVPNVHFVLGVNLGELANSVKARYGADVQGRKYLQKFITVSMPLVSPPSRSVSGRVPIKHFETVSNQIGLSTLWKHDFIKEYLGFVDQHVGLSLRDVEKIATLAMVTPSPHDFPEAKVHFYIGFLIMQVMAPSAVTKARQGQLTEDDVFSLFNLKEVTSGRHYSIGQAQAVWHLATLTGNSSISKELNEDKTELFSDRDPKELMRDVISQTLDVFEIMS